MIIDPIDLNLIRQLELHGSIPINEVISKFHISKKEIFLRIKNFEESGFINGYGFKLFLPGIHGGKWYWICAAIESTIRFNPENSVPYLEEVVENITLPQGVCPDVSILFYTTNLKETVKSVNKLPGVKYAEVYKTGEYYVTVPRVLLRDDWKAIAELYNIPKLNYARINTILNEPDSETEVRLSRLIWTNRNRKGIISMSPNFNWRIIKNYAHIHVAVLTKMRIKELRKMINELGVVGNIATRFKKRYLQIEFDVWGFSDFQTIINSLSRIQRLTIEGCSLAHKNLIYDKWIKKYIKEQL